jgi:hypothetical protein
MGKLGKQLVIFFIPLLICWLALEWFYRTQPNNYTYKNERIREVYRDCEILLLGSSHTFFGLDPEAFERPAFNLSNISQSLYFDELLLNKHIDSLPGLRAVVVPVGYFSLSQQEDGLEDRWRKYFYEQQMELKVPIVSRADPRRYSLALSRRLDRSLDLVKTRIKEGSLVSCYPNGYGMQDSSDIVNDKPKIAKLIARKHEDGSLDFQANMQRMQRMIDRCSERDILFIPVIMPVLPDYYQALRDDKWALIKISLDSLATANANTRFVDLSQDSRFTVDDLRDADHLTNQGAFKCSQLLSELIERYLGEAN